jgi:o-succinylbenzoate---CoA ligase
VDRGYAIVETFGVGLVVVRAVSEDLGKLLRRRLRSDWLVDRDGKIALEIADRLLLEFDRDRPSFVVISTLDPLEFIGTFLAAWELELPIFLGNPHWQTQEWERVNELIIAIAPQHRRRIMIPTGGSTGKVKFAMHTIETLNASVWGFREFYRADAINAVCTLPLYHVSGLMQLWRSLLTDGRLVITDRLQLNSVAKQIDLADYFTSLVPTQLTKLLAADTSDLLAKFQTILIGGAPASQELLTTARQAKLPLALTYGMTETASQITSLQPEEFWAGNSSCGRTLPHAHIDLISPIDNSGQIEIKAKSLMLGYFPDEQHDRAFVTDDLATIDRSGYLNILSRASDKIITGGENVFPQEVIQAIVSTELVDDVWVIGIPDRYWGQAVTAIYVAKPQVSIEALTQATIDKISKYKIPKYWLPVDRIPRNAIGKVQINELEKIARDRLDRF